jgi:hypothetical protein
VQRRRTQIRLAQRAYRSRKENAIQTLERRVQELQENNEELSTIFLKLHDSAVSLGVLEQSPRFAHDLRTATEKILSLARRSSQDDGHDEQAEASASEQNTRQTQRESSGSPDSAGAQPAGHSPTVPFWGGYMVANEPVTTVPDVTLGLTSSNMESVTQASLGYEIVTMPTFENASFPFEINSESPYPNILDSLSPYSSPPPLQSMSSLEPTFGRRLQRRSLELAYWLLTVPDPPKHKYAQTFGFCMLFESVDKIRERISISLERTNSESLNWWQAPFWAAGGSGQHQLQQDNSGSGAARVGNQGTIDQMKHSLSRGQFGLGPFDAKVSETRDKRIDARMRIRLPGFEGDWYDPEEVELYLRARGVDIQAGQDFVTAEVDVASFKSDTATEQPSQAQGQKQVMPGFEDWPPALEETFSRHPAPAEPSNSGGTAATSAPTSSIRTDLSTWPIGDFAEIFGRAAAGHDISGLGSSSGTGSEGRKKLITLDVNVFIRGTS